MSNKTKNNLLNISIMILLVIVASLGVLIYGKSKTVHIENTKDTFVDMQEETTAEEQPSEIAKEVEEAHKKQFAQTTTRVNIRDVDSEDGKVLETVEAGAQFEFVEIVDSGWTKIIYDGQDGYINSKFVKLIDAPTTEEMQTSEEKIQTSEDQSETVEEQITEDSESTKEPEEGTEEQATTLPSKQGDKEVIDASTIFH